MLCVACFSTRLVSRLSLHTLNLICGTMIKSMCSGQKDRFLYFLLGEVLNILKVYSHGMCSKRMTNVYYTDIKQFVYLITPFKLRFNVKQGNKVE